MVRMTVWQDSPVYRDMRYGNRSLTMSISDALELTSYHDHRVDIVDVPGSES